MRKIMIIDDDAEDALILLDAIEEVAPGTECFVAYSYQQARLVLDEEAAPDFIFLDALMYPIGGKEALSLLARMEKLVDTIIVVNSGVITQALVTEFTDLGADRVLQKPPNYNTMISSVKDILSIT